MKQNKKIAITGGIGSGKSLLGDILKSMGYEVYSCDEIYREMLQNKEYLALLNNQFPDCFMDGRLLNKKLLAERVFSSDENRKTLESLSHPMIMQRLLAQMEGKELVFAEVPLLFEGGFEGLFDCVIALVRAQEERVKGVMARGLTQEQVLSRMQSQFDPALLPKKNCIIVENNGSTAELKEKAEEIVKTLG